MIDFEFLPYKAVGPILFGDNKKEVFSKIGSPEHSFKKFRSDVYETDTYRKIGLIVHYSDKEGIVNFIESFEPSQVYYKEILLSNSSYKQTIYLLNELGLKESKDPFGYRFFEIGVALYLPNKKLEGVSFFKKGYYDE